MMECYIDYMDCENNFQETRKEFKNYDAAYNWMISNFEKWDIDWIKYF